MLVDGLTFMVLFALVLLVFVVGLGISDLMLRVWDWAKDALRLVSRKGEP